MDHESLKDSTKQAVKNEVDRINKLNIKQEERVCKLKIEFNYSSLIFKKPLQFIVYFSGWVFSKFCYE